VEIRTERLLLRPFRLSDVDDLFDIYSDERVAFFAIPASTTREELEMAVRDPPLWSDRPRFAVELTGRVVGDVILEIAGRDLIANVGYAVASTHWGRGIATEATRAVVDYGFQVFSLAKICARADPRNVASVGVMEKLGMVREGYFRSHVLRRGQRCDRVCYGLLRTEWERALREGDTFVNGSKSRRFDKGNGLTFDPPSPSR
jgi:RimJ/RimL family protein N-acetyltransferase